MTFDIIDIRTREKISDSEITRLTEKKNPVTGQNQFAVCEDGTILYINEAAVPIYIGEGEEDGQYAPVRSGMFPDLDFISDIMRRYIFTARPDFNNHLYQLETSVEMFQQEWPDTEGGFGDPKETTGERRFTQYTTVLEMRLLIGKERQEYIYYGVFFENSPAYILYNPKEVFFKDRKNHALKPVCEAGVY